MSTAANYYLFGAKGRTVTPANPPDLPPLDFTYLDRWVNMIHDVRPEGLTYSSGSYPGQVHGHGEQFEFMWADWRDNGIPPYRDGLYYYDFAKACLEAYAYMIARGNAPDPRFLQWATAAAEAYYHANQTGTYQMVYHFPDGVWLAQEYGILTTQQVIDMCVKYIRGPAPIGGSYWFGGVLHHEGVNRETARLLDFYLTYYRLVGQDDITYKINPPAGTDNQYWGVRYHLGVGQPAFNAWEWLREWTEAPAFGITDATDPIDYAARAINPSILNGIALFGLSPFMHHFSSRSLIRVIQEDANYQTPENINWVNDLTEFNHANGWFPPNGIPGNAARYGAYGYRYVQCSSQDPGCGVVHAHCQQTSGTYWCRNYGPTIPLTPFHLLTLAYAFRTTGDVKYRDRYVEAWEMMWANWSTIRTYAANDTWGGKSFNQMLFNLFESLNVMGYMNFKTAMYPQGYPYQTPPAVDPNP